MGRVVDESEASKTYCKIYGDGMVFSDGILGPLRSSQVDKYCQGKVHMPKSEELERQWDRVSLVSSINDVCLEEEISDEEFPACVKIGGELIGKGLSRREVEEKLSEEFEVEVD